MKNEKKKELLSSQNVFLSHSKMLDLVEQMQKLQDEIESKAITQQLNELLKGKDIIVENYTPNSFCY